LAQNQAKQDSMMKHDGRRADLGEDRCIAQPASIVIGAYGDIRAAEMVFGGVPRKLFLRTVPADLHGALRLS
jgi:hypothetical protein